MIRKAVDSNGAVFGELTLPAGEPLWIRLEAIVTLKPEGPQRAYTKWPGPVTGIWVLGLPEDGQGWRVRETPEEILSAIGFKIHTKEGGGNGRSEPSVT